jgi:hypothetical protein
MRCFDIIWRRGSDGLLSLTRFFDSNLDADIVIPVNTLQQSGASIRRQGCRDR